VLANVIERIGAAMPASLSLESNMLGAPFAPSTAGQIARLISSMTERVLRQDGVSYIFAGEQELDLALALEILNRELGLEPLLLEGGGGSKGALRRPPPEMASSGREHQHAGSH
jgi:hypothetical protein